MLKYQRFLQAMVKRVFPFLVIGIALASFYLPTLVNFQISGDDLYLIDDAPKTFSEIGKKFSDFSGQYRPLPQSAFSLYKYALPNTKILLLFNAILVIIVAQLFYANIRRLISSTLAILITIGAFISPIFYYHFFALASLNNTLLLIFALGTLLFIELPGQRKTQKSCWEYFFMSLLFFASMLTKESFLANAVLFFVYIFQNCSKKYLVACLLGTVGIITTYFGLHFSYYSVGLENEYALGNTLSGFLSSSVHFAAWFLAYPMGWQYAAADQKTILTYITTVVTGLWIFSLTAYYFFWKQNWKILLVISLSFLASLFPFFMIQRVLVFYLDFALLTFVFAFSVLLKNISNTKVKLALFSIFCLSFSLQYLLYFSQWHKHSFVAHAETTVQNFQNTLKNENVFTYDQLCIINHAAGRWATKDGRAARLLLNFQGKIYSSIDLHVPEECAQENTLLLENDGWEYKKYLLAN